MSSSASDSRVPGMACPGCGTRIVVTMDQLLSGISIVCPGCSGLFTVDREASRQALQALSDLNQRLRDSGFSR
jgi:hypothetical protein